MMRRRHTFISSKVDPDAEENERMNREMAQLRKELSDRIGDKSIPLYENCLWSTCTQCKGNSRCPCVFPLVQKGSGPVTKKTKIMVIGEAPGVNESKVGVPFVGRSGDFLSQVFSMVVGDKGSTIFPKPPFVISTNKEGKEIPPLKLKFSNDFYYPTSNKRSYQIYVTNVVKVRPTQVMSDGSVKDRAPTPYEVAQYLPYLIREIEILQPEVIICFGNIASVCAHSGFKASLIFNDEDYENPVNIERDSQRGCFPTEFDFSQCSVGSNEGIIKEQILHGCKAVKHTVLLSVFRHPSSILRSNDFGKINSSAEKIVNELTSLINHWDGSIQKSKYQVRKIPEAVVLQDLPQSVLDKAYERQRRKEINSKSIKRASIARKYNISHHEVDTVKEVVHRELKFSGVTQEEMERGEFPGWTKGETLFFDRGPTYSDEDLLEEGYVDVRLDDLYYNPEKNSYSCFCRDKRGHTVYAEFPIEKLDKDYKTFRFVGYMSIPHCVRKTIDANTVDYDKVPDWIEYFTPLILKHEPNHKFLTYLQRRREARLYNKPDLVTEDEFMDNLLGVPRLFKTMDPTTVFPANLDDDDDDDRSLSDMDIDDDDDDDRGVSAADSSSSSLDDDDSNSSESSYNNGARRDVDKGTLFLDKFSKSSSKELKRQRERLQRDLEKEKTLSQHHHHHHQEQSQYSWSDDDDEDLNVEHPPTTTTTTSSTFSEGATTIDGENDEEDNKEMTPEEFLAFIEKGETSEGNGDSSLVVVDGDDNQNSRVAAKNIVDNGRRGDSSSVDVPSVSKNIEKPKRIDFDKEEELARLKMIKEFDPKNNLSYSFVRLWIDIIVLSLVEQRTINKDDQWKLKFDIEQYKSSRETYTRYDDYENFISVRAFEFSLFRSTKRTTRDFYRRFRYEVDQITIEPGDFRDLQFFEFINHPVGHFTLYTGIEACTWFRIPVRDRNSILYARGKEQYTGFKNSFSTLRDVHPSDPPNIKKYPVQSAAGNHHQVVPPEDDDESDDESDDDGIRMSTTTTKKKEQRRRLMVRRETNCDVELYVSIDDIQPCVPRSKWAFHGHIKKASFDIEMTTGKNATIDDYHLNGIINISCDVQFQNESTKIHPRGIDRSNVTYSFALRKADEIPRYHKVPEHAGDLKVPMNTKTFLFNSEKELLKGWAYFLSQLSPDIIFGHYNKEFDDPRIIQRSNLLGLIHGYNIPAIGRVSRFRNRIIEYYFESRAHGTNKLHRLDFNGMLSHEDLVIILRREQKHPSHSLNYLSGEKLGDLKDDMPYSAIDNHHWSDSEKNGLLKAYCDRDCRLPMQIKNHDCLVANQLEFARTCGGTLYRELNVRGVQERCIQTIFKVLFRPNGLDENDPRRIVRDLIIRDTKDLDPNFEEKYNEYVLNDEEDYVDPEAIVKKPWDKEFLESEIAVLSNTIKMMDSETARKVLANSNKVVNCRPSYNIATGEYDFGYIVKTKSGKYTTKRKQIEDQHEKVVKKIKKQYKSFSGQTYSGAIVFDATPEYNGPVTNFDREEFIQSITKDRFAGRQTASLFSDLFTTTTTTSGGTSSSSSKNAPKTCSSPFIKKVPKSKNRKEALRSTENFKENPNGTPVSTLDFSSLYPSLMIAYNKSCETILTESEARFKGLKALDLLKCENKGPSRYHLYNGSVMYNQEVRDELSETLYTLRQEYLLTVYRGQSNFSRFDRSTLIRIKKSNLAAIKAIKNDYFDGEKYIKWWIRRKALASEDAIGENYTVKNKRTGERDKVYLCTDYQKGMGILAAVCVYLITHRNKAKAEMGKDENPFGSAMWFVYNSKQLALKLVANSIYGSTGCKGSNVRDTRVSNAVTSKGQVAIKYSASQYLDYFGDPLKHFNKGFDVAELQSAVDQRSVLRVKGVTLKGGDTDSIFVTHPLLSSPRRAMEFGLLLEFYFENMFRKPMKLLFEKVIFNMLILGKKHYTGQLCSGENNNEFYLKWIYIRDTIEDPEERQRIYSLKERVTQKVNVNDLETLEKLKRTKQNVHIPSEPSVDEEVFFDCDGNKQIHKIYYWKVTFDGDYGWWKNGVYRTGGEWKVALREYLAQRFAPDQIANDFEGWFEKFYKEDDEMPGYDHFKLCKFMAKGMDIVRRGTDPFVKETQKEYLNLLTNKNDALGALRYVYNQAVKLVNGDLEFHTFYLSAQYSKKETDYASLPAHIVAIQNQRKYPLLHLKEPSVGDRVYYIIGESQKAVNSKYKEEKPSSRAVVPEVARYLGIEPDRRYYFNRFTKAMAPLCNLIMGSSESIIFDYEKIRRLRVNNIRTIQQRNKSQSELKVSLSKRVYSTTFEMEQAKMFNTCKSCGRQSDGVLCNNCISIASRSRREKNRLIGVQVDKLKTYLEKHQQVMQSCIKCTSNNQCGNFTCKNYDKRKTSEQQIEVTWCDLEDIVDKMKSLNCNSKISVRSF